MPWKEIAEGITACALQLQRKPDQTMSGNYPDVWSVLTNQEPEYVETSNGTNQCGFRIGKSLIAALISLRERLGESPPARIFEIFSAQSISRSSIWQQSRTNPT